MTIPFDNSPQQQDDPNQPSPFGNLQAAIQQAAAQNSQPSPAPVSSPAPQPVQSQPQQSSQPPKPMPILYDLVKNLIHPQAQGAAGSRPASRVDALESFLGNSGLALSSGLSAAHGPGAGVRGAAAAMGAPYAASLQNWQLGQGAQETQARIAQQQAQTEQTRQQTEQAGQTVTLPDGTQMPLPLYQKIGSALVKAQGARDVANINAKSKMDAAQLQIALMANKGAHLLPDVDADGQKFYHVINPLGKEIGRANVNVIPSLMTRMALLT
jgi:hypothetical protein